MTCLSRAVLLVGISKLKESVCHPERVQGEFEPQEMHIKGSKWEVPGIHDL